MQTSLNEIAAEVHQYAVDHGFWPEEGRNFGEMIALATSELSEALEAHRSGFDNAYEIDGKPEGVAIELIDCLIRVLDMLSALDVDIDTLFELKMTYNKSRPYKHGRKY